MPSFTSIHDEGGLDRLFDESHRRPVVLFLHDEFCPISSMAYEEMLDVDSEIAVIDVTSQHDVRRAVEARSGVKHQSPQAIILRNGVATWNASHGRIRTESVRDAIEAARET